MSKIAFFSLLCSTFALWSQRKNRVCEKKSNFFYCRTLRKWFSQRQLFESMMKFYRLERELGQMVILKRLRSDIHIVKIFFLKQLWFFILLVNFLNCLGSPCLLRVGGSHPSWHDTYFPCQPCILTSHLLTAQNTLQALISLIFRAILSSPSAQAQDICFSLAQNHFPG